MKLAILSILMMFFLSTSAVSEDVVYTEGDFSYRLTDEGAIVEGWNAWEREGMPPVLEVPDTLGGKPVVSISSLSIPWQLAGRSDPSFELVIPEGVVSLGPYAFTHCACISTVYLPSTLETILEGSMVPFFAEIVFPEGNPCFVMNDGFLIDTRTDTLLYCAPSSCDKELPAVTHLGDSCLFNWVDDRIEVQLPDSISTIGTLVFYDLPYLERVVLPSKLTALDYRSLDAIGITELELPPTLTEIPAYCFQCCDFPSITIPNGVERIGEYAFYRCWDLTEVTLSESVQFVGYSAFPEECSITVLNPATHFETLEEYKIRDPEGEWVEE